VVTLATPPVSIGSHGPALRDAVGFFLRWVGEGFALPFSFSANGSPEDSPTTNPRQEELAVVTLATPPVSIGSHGPALRDAVGFSFS